MSLATAKMRWAQKLLRSKYFVVLTDKASVIALDGADPESFNDRMALVSQSTELRNFRDRMDELIQRHDKALASLTGSKVNKHVTTPHKRTKTIKVKKG